VEKTFDKQDAKLGLQAIETGKMLIGLETMQGQFHMIDSLPVASHIQRIDLLADHYNRLDDYQATILALFLGGQYWCYTADAGGLR